MAEVRRSDESKLGKFEHTSQGFVRVPANLTRTGIFNYHDANGKLYRELRLPDEVFKDDSLNTAEFLPVTVGHPTEMVSPQNVTTVKVGQSITQAAKNGDFVSSTLQIEDGSTIKQIEKGELVELSCGYTVDLDPTPGVWQGQQYDAVQRNIRFNHVSLLPAGMGRAGRNVALRIDSAATKIDEVHMDMITISVDGVEYQVDKAKCVDALKALASSDATGNQDSKESGKTDEGDASKDADAGKDAGQEGDADKGQVSNETESNTESKEGDASKSDSKDEKKDEAPKFDAAEIVKAVKEHLDAISSAARQDADDIARQDARVELVLKARQLDPKLDSKGKSARQIQEEALKACKVKTDGKDDAFVSAAFEIAVEARNDAGKSDLKNLLLPPEGDNRQDSQEEDAFVTARKKRDAKK